jgi:DNA-binding MarR family transcriptional regulator
MIENKLQLIDTLEVIRNNNLNLSAVLVLLILDTSKATYQRDIKTDFSPAKLSKNITKLIETGMLQAVEDREDSRYKILFITQTGHKLLKSIMKEE